jgi:anion-transporting  ArsA/GET3 family ATPase
VDVRKLLNSRLILVTGKGGTGKTTVSAALGRLSAERGARTIVAEVDTFRPALTPMLGQKPTYKPRAVAPNLDISNISWRDALVEWLRGHVPGQRVARRILDNNLVQTFLDATPGLRETVILSRVVTLLEQYDRVIVDMPASGHAISLLGVPNVAIGLMRGGPIRERAEVILKHLAAPTTALVIVGLPEEMVVNETVELWNRLKKEVPSLREPLVVLNRAALPSLSDAERALLERLDTLDTDGLSTVQQELIRAGRWEANLEASTAESLVRLDEELGVSVIPVARLGALGGFDGGPVRIVQQVASTLKRAELAAVQAAGRAKS